MCASLATSQQPLRLDPALISLDSAQGRALLSECGEATDALKLLMFFECQKNLAYCGPASAAMVLNALEIPRPESPGHGSFHIFTQENLFNETASSIKPASQVAQSGLGLNEFEAFVSSQGVSAKATYASDSNIKDFRRLVREVFGDPKRFLVVNYLRSAIGQETGGHFSPIAAYHQATERILVLDVSRYKYPPAWVRISDLWRAMAMDNEGQSRGYLLVESH